MLSAQGKIYYPPANQKPGWFFVSVEESISLYYKKLSNINWNSCLNGPHITFISGEKDDRIVNIDEISPYIGDVTFCYDPIIYTNSKAFWMKVICPFLDDIRKNLGLNIYPKGFHLTLGNIKNEALNKRDSKL